MQGRDLVHYLPVSLYASCIQPDYGYIGVTEHVSAICKCYIKAVLSQIIFLYYVYAVEVSCSFYIRFPHSSFTAVHELDQLPLKLHNSYWVHSKPSKFLVKAVELWIWKRKKFQKAVNRWEIHITLNNQYTRFLTN